MERDLRLGASTSPDQAAAAAPSAGKQSRSARRYGTAAVQQSATPAAPALDPFAVLAAARQGTSGTPEKLSFLEPIQASFGRHDVSNVEQYTDDRAAAANQQMGAKAFATGDAVAFAGAPDLHTAAHEAAHVVQQRGGVQLKDDVGASGDAYEQHADAVADKVVAGESAEALLDTMAGGGGGSGAVQRQVVQHRKPDAESAEERTPDGRVFSVNNIKQDAVTGLVPQQTRAVDKFQAEVQAVMGIWRGKRTTPELDFEDGVATLNRSLRALRAAAAELDGVSTVSNLHPVVAAGAQRIQNESYIRFLQEIRVFNAGTLGDYKLLLGFEDLKATHVYHAKAGASESGGVEIAGIGGGVETKDVTFSYSCPELGISWDQLVNLTGFKLSYTLSLKSAVGGAKGAQDPTHSPTIGGAAQKASDSKDLLQLEPSTAYLPPKFFGTARYTQLGVSAKASAGAALGGGFGAATSAMRIASPDRFAVAGASLIWESGWGPTQERTAQTGLKGPEAGADLGATAEVAEFGATLVGNAKLEGDLGQPEDTSNGMFVWVPLHMAWVFFNTGEASLTLDGLQTLQKLAKEVKQRHTIDNKTMTPKYKIEVVGSHSNRWSQYDDDIRRLQEQKRRSAADETELETLRVLKRAENEGLAMDRAREVNEAFKIMFPELGLRAVLTALPKDDGQLTVEGPLIGETEDEFANEGKDRRVEVRVSGLRYLPFGVPAGATLE
jgi:hypothetical protein